MALDRDLNISVVRAAFGPGDDRTGVDLFAATGVRGLRLLAETGRFSRFLFVDRHPAAVAALRANASPWGDRGARVVRGDAYRPPFADGLDYLDLDPYGSPRDFLEPAVGRVALGGLVGVTATDLQVLCGVLRGACQRRYGAVPLRGRLAPESGLRILLGVLARSARAQGRTLTPMAAYVHDHHLRAIVRITGPSGSEDPVGTIDPSEFSGPPLPPGGPYGPMWTGPLFDESVVRQMTMPEAAARPREAARWIARFQEEADVVAPFYYEPNEIARRLHLASPLAPDRLIGALRSAGFPAVRTHVRDGAFRSPAPWTTVESLAAGLGD